MKNTCFRAGHLKRTQRELAPKGRRCALDAAVSRDSLWMLDVNEAASPWLTEGIGKLECVATPKREALRGMACCRLGLGNLRLASGPTSECTS